jgi:hypothetical protein
MDRMRQMDVSHGVGFTLAKITLKRSISAPCAAPVNEPAKSGLLFIGPVNRAWGHL